MNIPKSILPRLHSLPPTTGTMMALALCFSPPATFAHHSQSEYDFNSNMDVDGKVTRLEWKSPHVWLHVVVEADGQKVIYDFELPSQSALMRRGWTRDSLKPGDRVKVNGGRARNVPTTGYARTIKDSNDKLIFTGITRIYEPEADATSPQR